MKDAEKPETGIAFAAEDMPLYRKVFISLRDEMLSGRYDATGVLPSEIQLERRFHVSRITVRRALDDLERAGLVERSKGRSTRVLRRDPDAIVDVAYELDGQLARGLDMRPRVLEFEWLKPSTELADLLEVGDSEDVLWITRIRSRRSKPVLHSAVYLPAFIGRRIERQALNHAQLLDVLRQSGHVIGSAEQTLSAAPCSPALSTHLDLAPGAPLFCIRRLIRDNRGSPLVLLQNSFRWDCFSYRVSLRPTKRGLQPSAEHDRARSEEAILAI